MPATWLPRALARCGYPVQLVPGWESRGRPGAFAPVGVMLHHTATPADRPGDLPTLRVLRDGRSDLRGPLSQVAVGRSGTWYVIAAGRANHAGEGTFHGISSGNTSYLGVELEHPGDGTPWPATQLDSMRRGSAELMRELHHDASFLCGHREYAPTRKIDPRGVDLDATRAAVAALLTPRPEPEVHPLRKPYRYPLPRHVVLRRGAHGSGVRAVQERVGAHVDGDFGPATERAVKAYQRRHRLHVDGVVGPATLAVLVKA